MCFYRVQYYRVLFSLYKTSVLGFWGGWHLHSLQWGKLIWDNCFKLETGIKLISRHHSTSKFSPFTPGLLPSTQRIKIPTPSRERGGGDKKKNIKKKQGNDLCLCDPQMSVECVHLSHQTPSSHSRHGIWKMSGLYYLISSRRPI